MFVKKWKCRKRYEGYLATASQKAIAPNGELYPNIGSVEPLLADRSIMYRSYVVNRLNKIVYFVKEDHIEVADFWDVRREPKKLSERV